MTAQITALGAHGVEGIDMQMRSRGFTIVELLIVIVVIAVLAAISIVAYNGVQNRSKVSSASASVAQTVKAIQAYVATTSTYPSTTNGCLTNASGCLYAGTAYPDTSAATAIASVSSLPGSIPQIESTNKGIVYSYVSGMTFNGSVQPARLLYVIAGNATNCGVSNVSNSGGTTMATSSTGYTTTNANSTLCIVSITGPAQ